MSRLVKTLMISAALSTLIMAGCADNNAPDGVQAGTPLSGQAMVAAADPRAVEAGLKVIAKGGSAADAAIAVQTVLGLVEPQSSGIGGGAFMIYHDAATGKTTMYDGRETAPAAVTDKLFFGDDGKRLPYVQGIASGRSTGVPGAIAMLHMAHEDHGKLPWKTGFTDAIKLGDEGFRVSKRLHESLTRSARFGLLAKQDTAREYFFIDPAGKTPLQIGYSRVNKPYADSLRAIAKDYRALYEGDIPKQIIAAVQEEPRPGVLSEADFAAYKPRKRDALCSAYREYTLCGAQPPSSGGVAVQSIMRTLEGFDMSANGPDTIEGWHLFIEASRLGYADRDEFVADDSFVDVPIKEMLDADYLASRRALIRMDTAMKDVKAGDPAGFTPGKDATPDSPGTSHFSIVDKAGNVVSMTTTVEAGFGSQRMAAGFMLNNQLTDFSFIPVDADGKAIANAVAPGKRPRSSMSPTIVFDADGDFYAATGSPGGNSIIAYTAKTLVGMLDWGLTPQQAADLPNVIARGKSVKLEHKLMTPEIVKGLENIGHTLRLSDGEASGIHIIKVDGDSYIGGADPRREGVALSLTDIGE